MDNYVLKYHTTVKTNEPFDFCKQYYYDYYLLTTSLKRKKKQNSKRVKKAQWNLNYLCLHISSFML